MRILMKLKNSTSGAAFTEYAILTTLVGAVAIFAVVELGESANNTFNMTENALIEQVSVPTTPATPDTSPESTLTQPAPTPPNNEYYAVVDGFPTNSITFDDVGDGEHDVVDMSAFAGSMFSAVNIEFWGEKDISIFDSSTGSLLNFSGVEELIVPASLAPGVMFELNTNGWETDPNFVLITIP